MPQFVLVSNLGLVNTYAGLVLPFLAGPFGVFLMRQFLLSIPDDLIEAARVDGAGEWRIFWRIVLPLCRPALATLGILTFLGVLEQLPVAAGGGHHRGQVHAAGGARALQRRAEPHSTTACCWPARSSSSLPVLIVFVVLQRHFVRGIATTGLK